MTGGSNRKLGEQVTPRLAACREEPHSTKANLRPLDVDDRAPVLLAAVEDETDDPDHERQAEHGDAPVHARSLVGTGQLAGKLWGVSY